ncbi:MAG: hypothetical protein RLZZ232_1212, partial [Planctomycetota bacterium]
MRDRMPAFCPWLWRARSTGVRVARVAV